MKGNRSQLQNDLPIRNRKLRQYTAIQSHRQFQRPAPSTTRSSSAFPSRGFSFLSRLPATGAAQRAPYELRLPAQKFAMRPPNLTQLSGETTQAIGQQHTSPSTRATNGQMERSARAIHDHKRAKTCGRRRLFRNNRLRSKVGPLQQQLASHGVAQAVMPSRHRWRSVLALVKPTRPQTPAGGRARTKPSRKPSDPGCSTSSHSTARHPASLMT